MSSANQHSSHQSHYGVTNQLDNNFGFYEDPFSPEQGAQYPIASGLVASMESDYSYSDASGAYRPVKGNLFEITGTFSLFARLLLILFSSYFLYILRLPEEFMWFFVLF